jgi:predicted dehydrogenase
VRCWLGGFASVSAMLPTVSERSGGAEDSYVLRFTLANGAEGVLQQTAGAWGSAGSFTRVAGTRGTLLVEGGVVSLADREGSRVLPVPPEFELPPPPAPSDDPRQRYSHIELGPYTRLCQGLRAAIGQGGAVSSAVPLPTFADGIACMETMDAIRASAAAGGERVRIGQ